jgi:acyl-CoA ligase (AMP-forming) (exosortase A-associated)
MRFLLHGLIQAQAERTPEAPAVVDRRRTLTYAELWQAVERTARGLIAAGLGRGERVAVYLEKRLETVIALFAAARAGGAFVPINPQLKPRQVEHILNDSGARLLVSSADRLSTLTLGQGVRAIAVDRPEWEALDGSGASHPVIDNDIAAILYTSGSTGLPKGVVLSHRNLLVGAQSVAQYLGLMPRDRVLALLPLSFDAGLSQLTTAFATGAQTVLYNYLLPNDVPRAVAEHGVTVLTGVPPLWIRLAELDWPKPAKRSLRLIANTGGHMPRAVLQRLRAALPDATPFLMYGLTEAFRSTYLDPVEIDRRIDSIGKAIPNAEILVVRPDGSLCDAEEPGELVHRGALVSLGYWNDPARTAERFRPAPGQPAGLPYPELAVWSGDIVHRDKDGFLYFVGRRDEMIKTSGYRVSPTEIEEVLYASGLVGEAVAVGVADPVLGQAIVAVVAPAQGTSIDLAMVQAMLRRELPPYMVPQRVDVRPSLPRNPNGKIDRASLARELSAGASA